MVADASANCSRRVDNLVLSLSPGQGAKLANWIQERVIEAGVEAQWPVSNPRLIKKCPSGLNIS